MDRSKLEKWAELLLDTGKRNNLISFHDTKSSTVEILKPDAVTLFEKATAGSSFQVFEPVVEDLEQLTLLDDEDDAADVKKMDRETYLNTFGDKLRNSNQILVYGDKGFPRPALRSIDRKAKSFLDETGVNVLHLAFGFVEWWEAEHSKVSFKAPLLLVPVEIKHDSMIDPFEIKIVEDEITVNPTFSYKMMTDQGVRLPEYEDEGLESYLEKVSDVVSLLGWNVTDECKLGLFSFLKINMYQDLKNNADRIMDSPIVRLLMGDAEPYMEYVSTLPDVTKTIRNPLVELHNVVDADSSQIEAIMMAKSGESFVLQGPPGTGKSQTITNIIAECLHDGKKVLFVSEKLAALNVVYDKLKSVGLEEFCLELHSHKANKKTVIDELVRTLELPKSGVSSKADREIALKEDAQKQLDRYAEALHKKKEGIDKTPYQLYEDYARYDSAPTVRVRIRRFEGEQEAKDLLKQYVAYLPSIGTDYRKNAWYGYNGDTLDYDAEDALFSDLQSIVNVTAEANRIADQLEGKYEIPAYTWESAGVACRSLALMAASDVLTPAMMGQAEFAYAYDRLTELRALGEGIKEAEGKLSAVFDQKIYTLDGEDLNNRLLKLFSGSFSRLFNAEYKGIITDLRLCSKDGGKFSYDEAVGFTSMLAKLQSNKQRFEEEEKVIAAGMGPAYRGLDTDWDALFDDLDKCRDLIEGEHEFGNNARQQAEVYQSRRTEFGTLADSLQRSLTVGLPAAQRLAGMFDPVVCDFGQGDLSELGEKAKKCIEEKGRLTNWNRFSVLLKQLESSDLLGFITAANESGVSPDKLVDSYMKAFYGQQIETICRETPELDQFSRITQDHAVDQFKDKDELQFEISKAQIRAELSANRPSLDFITPGSAVGILKREGEKKRKQLNIRQLLERTGPLVQTLKPCFLMSPLSVSTYLKPGVITFDTVIFDEASQIFPQDAMGAIYRGNQLIVVGDSHQMPPSNFFNTAADVDDEDEEEDIADFESILDLCSTTFKQRSLGWHYRSRFEELIAFSNKNYYNNTLITFPSSSTNKKGIGIDFFPVKGTYDKKTRSNLIEAEKVVDLVFENIRRYPKRSMGVVAFSVSQQNLIDKLLSKRRQQEPAKEWYFSREKQEPFFVKNLETVQGDERDTIIFSVAYGPDPQGRIMYNFGPLNRVGGERRLNVAVTRAKSSVQLVASMHYTDLDLTRTKSEGARLLREYLDYAENGKVAMERTISVSAYDQFDSDFEMEVCEFLRGHGFSVDTQVGCSSFKIDLGLKSPETSDYVLAIECDGASYHSSKNARDRDRLRQAVLERMGWTFYRIWSTDWFRNKSVEQQRLLEAAQKALDENSYDAPVVQTPEPEETEQEQESFEVELEEQHYEFPEYKIAHVREPFYPTPASFQEYVRQILEVESPLSEDVLLHRCVYVFGREKVTSVVQRSFETMMYRCQERGIIRRNGFLYLDGKTDYELRVPTQELKRTIQQIAPEELAAGMLMIIQQNVTVDVDAMFRTLLNVLDFKRKGQSIDTHMFIALNTIKDKLVFDGNNVSLKE